MRYYYDTEFLEDGGTIDLISIGIYAEDGREYYAVSSEFDTRRVAKHDWLMLNVMTSIDHEAFIVTDADGYPFVRDLYVTDPAVKTRDQIRRDIVDFIGWDRTADLWAWYGAYDHVALAQLFGPMISLPHGVPMFTNDIKTLVKLAGNPKMPAQPSGLHNALADAKFNKVRYDFLVDLLQKREVDLIRLGVDHERA